MNIEKALTIEGFMEPAELDYLAHVASGRHRIAEIGSWKGRSAIAMASNTRGLIYCVDTWSGHLESSENLSVECFRDFLRNTAGFINILPVPLESCHAAAIFGESGYVLDMVFIDGRHDFVGVERDIKAWTALLRTGGILCGHDYGHPDWPDVKEAVNKFVPKFRIVPGTNIWTTEDCL